jgi:hypothetical protein
MIAIETKESHWRRDTNENMELLYKFSSKGMDLSKILLQSIILPYPHVASLLYNCASTGNSPQSFRNRCVIIQVQFWVIFFDCICGHLRIVVGDGGINVVRNVRSANFVVQKINCAPRIQFIVRTIDCVEGAPHVSVVIFGEMRHINVSVLQPETRWWEVKESEKRNIPRPF